MAQSKFRIRAGGRCGQAGGRRWDLTDREACGSTCDERCIAQLNLIVVADGGCQCRISQLISREARVHAYSLAGCQDRVIGLNHPVACGIAKISGHMNRIVGD